MNIKINEEELTVLLLSCTAMLHLPASNEYKMLIDNHKILAILNRLTEIGLPTVVENLTKISKRIENQNEMDKR